MSNVNFEWLHNFYTILRCSKYVDTTQLSCLLLERWAFKKDHGTVWPPVHVQENSTFGSDSTGLLGTFETTASYHLVTLTLSHGHISEKVKLRKFVQSIQPRQNFVRLFSTYKVPDTQHFQ